MSFCFSAYWQKYLFVCKRFEFLNNDITPASPIGNYARNNVQWAGHNKVKLDRVMQYM